MLWHIAVNYNSLKEWESKSAGQIIWLQKINNQNWPRKLQSVHLHYSYKINMNPNILEKNKIISCVTFLLIYLNGVPPISHFSRGSNYFHFLSLVFSEGGARLSATQPSLHQLWGSWLHQDQGPTSKPRQGHSSRQEVFRLWGGSRQRLYFNMSFSCSPTEGEYNQNVFIYVMTAKNKSCFGRIAAASGKIQFTIPVNYLWLYWSTSWRIP